MIAEAPALKEGTGPELRKLCDTVQQQLRALKAMKHEPPGAFITFFLELKLDTTTMFEWQQASQEHTDVPHYSNCCHFLTCIHKHLKGNLRAHGGNFPGPNTKRTHLEA